MQREKGFASSGRSVAVVLAAVVCSLLLVSGAYAASTIRGTVTDASTGIPLSGASVTLSTGQAASTAGDGAYAIAGLPAGTYTITIRLLNYYIKSKTITVGADSTVTVDFPLVPVPAGTPAVSDTFSRPDGSDLGVTEDANAYPWVRANYEPSAELLDGKLVLNGPSHAIGGVSVGGGFQPADFDMTVDITIENAVWGGVAYRQQDPGTFDIFHGQDGAFAGYLVYCPAAGNVVNLHRNGALASAAISPAIDWSTPHTVRIRAVGAHHQVWIDGQILIDVMEGNKLSGGYIGCLRHTEPGTVRFDNFTVGTIEAPTGIISGRVYDADNPGIGLANVTVSTSTGLSATTDSTGNYSITVGATSLTRINVAHDDYYPQTVQNIEPLPNQTVTVDVALTHLPVPGTTDIVTDTFSRADDTNLGTTEDVNHYPWMLGAGETEAYIAGEQLYLGYGPLASGASVDGEFLPADFDMTVDIAIQYADAVSWAGVAYRQDSPGTFDNFHGADISRAGYLVYFLGDGTQAALLRAGGTIATADLSESMVLWFMPHTVRVRAVGAHHQVWLDGEKIIDVFHSGKLTGGYVGCLRWGAEVTVDNLNITRYGAEPGQISGSVFDAANPGTKIAGARVMLGGGRFAYTDANGQYSFAGLPLQTYAVSATSDSYYARVTNVTLSQAQPTRTVDFGLVALPEAGPTVTDTFTRADSADLGTTEDPLALPWVKSNGDESPRISSNTLRMDPFGVNGVSLGGGFMPADVDISVDLSMMGVWCGIAYRQPQPGTFDNHHGADITRTGYLVWCPENGAAIHFFRAGAFLRTAHFANPIDWSVPHTLRVRATGIHHEVWLDGEKVIDALDAGKLGGGYVTILRDNAYLTADNLSVATLAALPDVTITGTVHDADNPALKIAGATVFCADGGSMVTDSQGVYTFTIAGSALTSGSPAISVSAPGYLTTTSLVVNATPGAAITQNIALPKLPADNLVFDTFSRPDSTSLGATEDDLHRPWMLCVAETAASISGGQLRLSAGPYASGASVGGGFMPADFEMTVDMSIHSGDWGGVAYRQATVGTFDNFYGGSLDTAGYLVWSPLDGSVVYLWRIGRAVAVAAMSPAIDWSVPHTLKIRAIGDHHQIYLDGHRIIDVHNNEKLAGGYLTLIRWVAQVRYDNFAAATGGLLPDSVEPVTPVANVVEAKTLADGTLIELSGAIVTGAFSGFFYVEDADRVAGIKVIGGQSVQVGDAVTVQGKLGTANGERNITATSVQTISSGNTVKPLAMTGKAFAGPVGLSNIGLLTTICGNVTAVSPDQTYCYVDDGSGVSYEPGTLGIKVLVPGPTKPTAGETVTCSGVAGMLTGSVPALIMRTDTDLVILP